MNVAFAFTLKLVGIVYGYEEVDEVLMPDMAVTRIPNEYALQCNCTKCANVRCICLKNGLPCCKFCKCQRGEDTDSGLTCRNPSGCV